MAKKGGVQQLQADITTDEEFDKLLDRPGLLVLDIYSEWCGPCLGMVGSLKKIKLELGGDNLQLAICKSDNIQALERFRNKSEPTWLFVVNRQAVNLMFGTDVPKLMKVITIELDCLERPRPRPDYDITELQPEEIERLQKILAAEEEARQIEEAAAKQRRIDYLNQVTNEILINLPDIGITLFGPQFNRDMFKKLMEPADNQHITVKDRKPVTLTPEEMDIVNYACTNPIDPLVLEQLYSREVLLCYWKLSDEEKRPVVEVMQAFGSELTKPQPLYDEFGMPYPDIAAPPIIPPLEIKVKAVRPITPEISEEEVDEKLPSHELNSEELLANMMGGSETELNDEEEGEQGEQDDENADDKSRKSKELSTMKSMFDVKSKAVSELDFVSIVNVPAFWTPGNKKTTAACIYVFFRHQTVNFLPPDPVPDPPHIVIAFDAYKKKDIVDIFDKFKEDILSYGFFSNHDPDSARLISNSLKDYERAPHAVTDKIVIKVAKVTSHALLQLSTQGPSYVSPNTVIGKIEGLKFFPEGYKTGDADDNGEEELENETEKKKKKKKRKKGSDDTITSGTADQDTASATDDPDAVDGEEAENADGEFAEGEGGAVAADGEAPPEGQPEAEVQPESTEGNPEPPPPAEPNPVEAPPPE